MVLFTSGRWLEVREVEAGVQGPLNHGWLRMTAILLPFRIVIIQTGSTHFSWGLIEP